jgi:hypothetical protein
LLGLQRWEDIVVWPKSAIDLEQNTIKVSPGERQNYGKPVHLEIIMGQALREVVLECIKSPVVCPYLIHYSPKARKRSKLDAKLNWNTVTANCRVRRGLTPPSHQRGHHSQVGCPCAPGALRKMYCQPISCNLFRCIR